MASRKDIIQFCQEYLQTDQFEDGCHNGLQVEGAEKVKKIVTGVTFSQQLAEKAIEKEAQMIMSHHGLFGKHVGDPPRIKNFIRKRLKTILENDINLAGFHLPLDAHPEIGNNISLAQDLGLSDMEAVSIGFVGKPEDPISLEDFIHKVEEKVEGKSYAIKAGPEQVSKVGIVSGGGSPFLSSMLDHGIDTFVTGDIRENVVREVEEMGVNFINAWHYNTEKKGIYNLGNMVADKFGVEVEFVDIPCDI